MTSDTVCHISPHHLNRDATNVLVSLNGAVRGVHPSGSRRDVDPDAVGPEGEIDAVDGNLELFSVVALRVDLH